MTPTTPSGTRTRSDPQAVGAHPALDHLADGVGQRRHLAQAVGHGPDPLGGEPQPVEGHVGGVTGPGPLEVGGVVLEQVVVPLFEQVGGHEQRTVLGGAVRHQPGPGRPPWRADRDRRCGPGPCSRVPPPRALPGRRSTSNGPTRVPPPSTIGCAQTSTTRSSRCTISGAAPSGNALVRRPAHDATICGPMTSEPLGEDHAVGPRDLHGVVGVEAARHRHHPGREQRGLTFHERETGSFVHDEGPRGGDGERDPQLPGRQAPSRGPG